MHKKITVMLITALIFINMPFAVCAGSGKGIIRSKDTAGKRHDENRRVLHALVIGINRFQDSRIRDLRFCRADAEALYDLLNDRRYSPFSVINARKLIDEDATRENVKTVLTNLGREAAPEDTVIIYFSSHGIQQDEGKAYWVLNDSKADPEAFANNQARIWPESALSQSEISALLGRIKARRLVVLVDCCFSAATVISYPRGKDFKIP